MGTPSTKFQKQLLLDIKVYRERIAVLTQQQKITSVDISDESIRIEINATEEKMLSLKEGKLLNEELEKIYNRKLQLLRMMLSKEIPNSSISVLLQIEEAEERMEKLQRQLDS